MTLYRETLCEHNLMEPHHFGSMTMEQFSKGEPLDRCPGGTREEVNPNIEAAIAKARLWAAGTGLNDYAADEMGREIVDAALTRGDTE